MFCRPSAVFSFITVIKDGFFIAALKLGFIISQNEFVFLLLVL